MLEVMARRFLPTAVPPVGSRGFTLIELLVTMVVMAVLLSIAAPSFQAFVAGQRTKAATTELMSTLMLARSEAVKRNGTVSISPLTAGDWTSGWTVKSGTLVLNRQEALQGLTVAPSDYPSCTTGSSISTVDFSANGRPTASGCFKIASTGAPTPRCVKLDLTGIPSSGTC